MSSYFYSNSEDGKVKKRIGLITPYQGFNYGDAAIQDAMIGHLTELAPYVECYGMTLYPADTEIRHKIASFPITGLVVCNYSEAEMLFARELLPPQRSLEENEAREIKVESRASGWRKYIKLLRDVKKLPLVGGALRYIVFRLRDLRLISVEVREFVRACLYARKMDLLVLSGGGQLDEAHGGPWGHPYVIYRWSLIARLTRTPFVVASVGSAVINPGLTSWFIKKGLRSADYRSYRDEGTKTQLSAWEFTRDDPIVRDLALAIDASPYLSSQDAEGAACTVAVSPIYHSDPAYTAYNEFVEGICDFIEWLSKRGDRVLLFRTTSIERLVLRDIWDNLRQRNNEKLIDQVEEIEAPCYQDLMKKIAVADLVVASRLHSIILSHTLNKPTLAISWDRKVQAHMQDFEQSRYMINIESLNGDILKEKFGELERNAEVISESLRDKIAGVQPEIKKQTIKLLQHAGLKVLH